eukprot:CAMPEP_0116907384 /NCGR_PEP_ID=MMETSP0467-20121206/13083_1 /TAXON_ID=283647 /ORGANISM="Mesodinium pulex, Strain SPMC105" /LENGTH=147 /DNA_ID=CAMNT_0004582411 /DNA_START=1518 /DNA_END=1961 /DNA_ORIENTATION=-
MEKENLEIELKNINDSHSRELNFIKEKSENEVNSCKEKLKERDNSVDLLSKQLQSEKQNSTVEINKLMSKLSMYESEKIDEENTKLGNTTSDRGEPKDPKDKSLKAKDDVKSMVWAMFQDLKELKKKDILYEHRLDSSNKISQLDKQ